MLSVFMDKTRIPPVGLPEAEFRAKLQLGEEFLRNASGLFPPGAIGEASLRSWRRVLAIVNTYRSELHHACNLDEDYCSLVHPNMNVDNTWWWRDHDRRLRLGVLDWGALGNVSLPCALWWSLYACELDFLVSRLDELLELFVRTYQEEGGPRLELRRLRRLVFFSALEQLLGLLGAIPAIYRAIPKRRWTAGEVRDRRDPRLRSDFLTRMYALGLVLVTRMIPAFDLEALCEEFLSTPGLPRKTVPAL